MTRDSSTALVAPLNALGRGLSIWVKSMPSEGLLHKKDSLSDFPSKKKTECKSSFNGNNLIKVRYLGKEVYKYILHWLAA